MRLENHQRRRALRHQPLADAKLYRGVARWIPRGESSEMIRFSRISARYPVSVSRLLSRPLSERSRMDANDAHPRIFAFELSKLLRFVSTARRGISRALVLLSSTLRLGNDRRDTRDNCRW